MNCNNARQFIMEHLDGELPPAATRELQQHLAQCEACRIEMQRQQRLIGRVKSLPHEPAPEGFAEALARAAAAESSSASRNRWLRRYGAMAASIAVFLVAGVMFVKTQSTDSGSCLPCQARRQNEFTDDAPPADELQRELEIDRLDSPARSKALPNALAPPQAAQQNAAASDQAPQGALAKAGAPSEIGGKAEAITTHEAETDPALGLAKAGAQTAPLEAEPPAATARASKAGAIANRELLADAAALPSPDAIVSAADVNAAAAQVAEVLGRHCVNVTIGAGADGSMTVIGRLAHLQKDAAYEKQRKSYDDARTSVLAELRKSSSLTLQRAGEYAGREARRALPEADAEKSKQETIDRGLRGRPAADPLLINILIVPQPARAAVPAVEADPGAAVMEAKPAEDPND